MTDELRGVPPEGGPRADEQQFIYAAYNSLWAALSKVEFKVSAEQWSDICRELDAFRSCALRASGAGTRQEEPLWARQIAAIDRWQFDHRVHPLTCGNDSGHKNLIPALVYGEVVLLCPECDYMQTHIPDVVTDADFVAPLAESRPNE